MLTLLDRSNYLRGLFVLSRLDQTVSDYEKKALVKIGSLLGFQAQFCANAAEELAANNNISERPPVFSNQETGLAFTEDALKLALSDRRFHIREYRWISDIAMVNKIKKSYWTKRAHIYRFMNWKDLLSYDFAVERLMQ